MRSLKLFGIWLTGILGAGALGAITNAINANISERYYRIKLGWFDIEHINQAIIAQGIFEGLVLGLILSSVLTTAVGLISRGECSYSFGIRHTGGLLLSALICWIIGGLLAMALAVISPEFYMHAFMGVPEAAGERIRYAWVGGSIWGVEFGGIGATLVMIALFRAAWMQKEA